MKPLLNNVEKFAVQGMLQNNTPLPKIAEELKKPLTLVEAYVNIELKQIQDTIENVNKPKKPKNMAIMTQAQSEKADDIRDNSETAMSHKLRGCLFNSTDGKAKHENSPFRMSALWARLL